MTFLIRNQQAFQLMLRQHLLLVGLAVGLAVITAVPLGIVCARSRRLAVPITWLANLGQCVPSLVLLALVLPFLGIGFRPALAAVYARAVLPILLNTYAGIDHVDPAVKEAAAGMGMRDWQILARIEFPLAFPIILAGVKTAAVQSVAIATLAAFIGAGGLGDFIMRGVSMVDTSALLAGAVPVALLAILVEFGLGWLERVATPRGVRQERSGS